MIKFLSIKSLRDRKLITGLCILSVALSLSLFLIVEKLRVGVEDGFTNSISNADLIVGARSGPLQLLLYSIFHIGAPTNNISINSYNKIKSNHAVKWTIPISLGDSYRGHRVVATTEDFFNFYQFYGNKKISMKEGQWGSGLFDVVLGSGVARKLRHKLNDSITLSHGVSKSSIMEHDNSPFRVVGVLNPTGTPVDKSLYISLQGMQAIHIDWENGIPNYQDSAEVKLENLNIDQITSFILRTKNRISLLGLQRYISTYEEEALSAIIPAMTLAELWGLLDQLESVLLGISLFVVAIGFLTIFISLYMSLNERKREIAILRSVGVSARQITLLLFTEAFLISFIGACIGVVFQYGFLFVLSPILESLYALYIPFSLPSNREIFVFFSFIILGSLFGVVPAIKAYRSSLSEGLLIK